MHSAMTILIVSIVIRTKCMMMLASAVSEDLGFAKATFDSWFRV